MSSALRRLFGPAAAFILSLGLVATAQAQDIEDEIDAALADEPAEEAAPASNEPLPEIGEDQLAVFVLDRGFYFSSDLGVFMTFAGVRGYSNVQPYLSLKAGFDIGEYLSVQAAFAAGYASGNPISENDRPGAGGFEVANYGLFSMGAEVVGALRPTPRFAIEPKVGGGLTRLDPAPTSISDLGTQMSPFAPHVSGGIDFKYLTLLTDFTAGVSLTGYYIIGPNIPAGAIAAVVRYTF